MPDLSATIERRLLINYRVDPRVAEALLPAGFRPQLVDGSAVAGICLIRLGDLRPARVRPRVGWHAENAAHRIAVEWDTPTGPRTGVFIPERHSASWLAVAAGERIFPGIHRHAQFVSDESADRMHVVMRSTGMTVDAGVVALPELPGGASGAWGSSLFPTLDAASEFFRAGSTGWSPTRSGALQGLTLSTSAWRIEGGKALTVRSSYFDALLAGSAKLDSVLVMRGVPVTWSVPALSLTPGRATTPAPAAP
ncbi:hypothetical protein B7R22_06635 [Subtercola boreus]|uniref:DUF2071 domain-containing protein n=1 Tax=Subtercola boreus TaxID=120213 RepID=A0A3E0W165_9MICO|nr:DUF2071 domain-containing protein [Subtercola boreus]RFA15555.1 hypothetical protein B7R22_06635 [Subtercola boreus]